MIEVTIHVDAAHERIWRNLVDVERWPEWTSSITRVENLDDGALRIGYCVRIKQPKMPTMVWRVTDLEPNRSFSWSAKSPGVTTTGAHEVVPSASGGSDITLTISQRGAFAPLVRLLYGRRTRRYMELEADGLKCRSESEQGRDS